MDTVLIEVYSLWAWAPTEMIGVYVELVVDLKLIKLKHESINARLSDTGLLSATKGLCSLKQFEVLES